MVTRKFGPSRVLSVLLPVLTLAAPPAAEAAEGLPGVQVSCGSNQFDFLIAITPAVVNAGQNFTISWCNAAYTEGAYGFTPSYYRLYQNSTQNGTYHYVTDYGTTTFSDSLPTAASEIGQTRWYTMRAWGTAIDPGGNYPSSRDSNLASVQIVASGGGGGGGGGSATCTPNATTLCLMSRFQVQADWRNYGGTPGTGNAVSMTSDTGYFWFSAASNVEVVVKMVNFCGGAPPNYSIYAGGMTDLYVKLKVTDTLRGTYEEYTNPLGIGFSLIRDGPFTCP